MPFLLEVNMPSNQKFSTFKDQFFQWEKYKYLFNSPTEANGI